MRLDTSLTVNKKTLKECKDETINYSMGVIENKAFNRKIRQKF